MYTVKTDLHTHTLFSGHAFSTIGENVAQAVRKGLEAIGMADHYSPLFLPQRQGGFPDWGPIMNMAALPKVIDGVRVLASVEIDLVDFEGHPACWDLPCPFTPPGAEPDTVAGRLLRSRDYAIASFHGFPGAGEGTAAQYTEMYCGALRNPLIHILGHPCRPGFPFDLEEVIRTAKETGKMLEINDHSFDSPEHIQNACRQLVIRCAEEEVPIVVSSDAHSAWFVGEFDRALTMLQEISFPERLIANRTLASFQEKKKKIPGRIL